VKELNLQGPRYYDDGKTLATFYENHPKSNVSYIKEGFLGRLLVCSIFYRK
jgi:hypothetical protein